MQFAIDQNGTLEISDLHPLLAGLLTELPQVAARHGQARKRLYPDPVTAEGEAELRADWRDHVMPELERLFAESREVVARDVAPLANDSSRLVIPADHGDAWLNALNQARLIIVEENGFTEEDLDQREAPDLADRRGLALLKLHFYAHVQEMLVEAAG